jgi:hypothetical protein
MPKELTHIYIAHEVVKQLKRSGQQLLARVIMENLPAFHLGAIIPDAFFYDVVPFRKIARDCAQVARALHLKETAKNDKKAVAFFEAIAADPRGWPSKVAFSAGIVTHTVGDRIVHDLIDHYTKAWGQSGRLAVATHRQIETLIDMVLLQPLGLRPGDFRLKRLLRVDRTTKACLFRFYIAHMMEGKGTLSPYLLKSLDRACTQQRIFVKLFTVKPLYRMVNLSNELAGGGLQAWSRLFYPDAIRIQAFPILKRLDLNALTNGRSFTGPLYSLIDVITTDAVRHINVGLGRLA